MSYMVVGMLVHLVRTGYTWQYKPALVFSSDFKM